MLQSKLLVAISGGVDSIVLTYLCHNAGLDIGLAHCNFNLRGKESDADEQFVLDLAKTLNIEVFTKSFDTAKFVKEQQMSIQMAARELRYQWFEELIGTLKFDYVLTAHQADDELETFLINLSRGSGLDGLKGIPPINKNVIRPLLKFSRKQILNYANETKLNWREDSSNEETKYLRNKLRHEVIPVLKETNPVFLSNFLNTITHLKGSSQIIDKHISRIKSELFLCEDDLIKIPVIELKKLEPIKPYLFEILKDFGFTEWDDVVSILDSVSGKQIFSSTHRMVKDRDFLLIKPISSHVDTNIYKINEEEQCVLNPIPLSFTEVDKIEEGNDHVIYIDKEKLKFPLVVRKRQQGDYFYPFGMEGKKKLSKFFKDEKYSLLEKEGQWLLCSGNEIVWVIGKRLDDRFKVAADTSKIVKIKEH